MHVFVSLLWLALLPAVHFSRISQLGFIVFARFLYSLVLILLIPIAWVYLYYLRGRKNLVIANTLASALLHSGHWRYYFALRLSR